MAAKILVIEDDPVTQDILAHLLRARGHVVATAADGDAAVKTAAIMVPDVTHHRPRFHRLHSQADRSQNFR